MAHPDQVPATIRAPDREGAAQFGPGAGALHGPAPSAGRGPDQARALVLALGPVPMRVACLDQVPATIRAPDPEAVPSSVLGRAHLPGPAPERKPTPGPEPTPEPVLVHLATPERGLVPVPSPDRGPEPAPASEPQPLPAPVGLRRWGGGGHRGAPPATREAGRWRDDILGRNGCRRIPAPAGGRRNRLALHQEGVGIEYGTVAHCHAVMDERADAERAVGADDGVAGLEGAVLLRVALNLAARIQHGMVADGDQGPLRQIAPVVEDPAARAGHPASARSDS